MHKFVRHAQEKDYPALVEIEKSADLLFEKLGIGPMPPPTPTEDYYSSKCVLVYCDPPKGFVRLEEIDGHAHIEQISVDLGSMGHGVGGSLMNKAIDWSKSQDYNKITLITFKNVRWNENFYKKFGFLESNDFGAGIKKLLACEEELGLNKLGKRIVMQRDL